MYINLKLINVNTKKNMILRAVIETSSNPTRKKLTTKKNNVNIDENVNIVIEPGPWIWSYKSDHINP